MSIIKNKDEISQDMDNGKGTIYFYRLNKWFRWKFTDGYSEEKKN